jgi:hypothetical protein
MGSWDENGGDIYKVNNHDIRSDFSIIASSHFAVSISVTVSRTSRVRAPRPARPTR